MPSENIARRQFFSSLKVSPAFAIPSALSMVQLVVLIRMLPQQEYGTLVLCLTTAALVTGVAGEPVASAVLRFRAGGDLTTSKAGGALTIPLLLFGGLGAYAFVLVSGFRAVALPLAGLVATQLVIRQQVIVLRAEGRLSAYSAYVAAQSIVTTASSVALAVTTKTAAGVLWGTAAASLGVLVVLIVRLGNPIQLKADRQSLRKFCAYSVPVAATAICGQALNVADRFMVNAIAGRVELAAYYANYALAERPVGLVFAPLLAAAQPSIFRLHDQGSTSEANAALQQLMRVYLCIAVPLLVFMAYFARDLSRVVAGERYATHWSVIPVVVLGVTLWNLAIVTHQPLELARSTRTITLFVALAAASNLVCNLLLIPRLGGLGAAISTTAAYALYFGMISLYLGRHKQRRPTVPPRLLVSASLVSLAFGGAVLLSTSALAPLPRLALGVAMGAVTVACMLYIEMGRGRKPA